MDPIRLTKREQEILQQMAEGKKAQEIADDLFVSPRTIHFHQASIYEKLGVNKNVQAIKRAFALGIATF